MALEASRICQGTEQERDKGKQIDYFEDSDSSQEFSTGKRRGGGSSKRKRKLRAVEDVAAAVIPVERVVNLTHEQVCVCLDLFIPSLYFMFFTCIFGGIMGSLILIS